MLAVTNIKKNFGRKKVLDDISLSIGEGTLYGLIGANGISQATLVDMERFYRGYYAGWDKETFFKLLDWFALPSRKKVSGFSKGMQRRAGLAAAFSSGADYLFLDEAFDGLDLKMRQLMRQILKLYVKKRNATAVLSSHNLSELEKCVERFGMLQDGKLVCDTSVESILSQGVGLEEYFLRGQEEKNYDRDRLF